MVPLTLHACALATALSVAAGRLTLGSQLHNSDLMRLMGGNLGFVFTLGAFMLHLVFAAVLMDQGSRDGTVNIPAVIILACYSWPLMLASYDATNVDKYGERDADTRLLDTIDVSSEAAVIVGLIFAVSSICSKVPPHTQQTPMQEPHVGIVSFKCFAIALILCIALVIPTPNLAAASYPRRITRGVKKSVLNSVIGLLVLGIVARLYDVTGNDTGGAPAPSYLTRDAT